ncbi:MAG: terminase family protein [Clostridia bacterium]|nr:terminase family protein [Clostridia bacterium]
MAVKEFEWDYNPVKQTVNGQAAERVVWSTNAFNIAVDAIKKGLPLKANPFCGKNVKLLKPDLVYRRTQEEIDDYIRCKEDPVYFASKCYLMTPEGLKPCILRDYQIDYLRMLQKNNFTIMLSCRQAGKSTTTAIFCLWVILFNIDMTGLILSKSGPAGVDLLSKLKDMYLNLPYYLKAGTMKWNMHEIGFDNNSSISTEAFSPTAGLGKTINFLILDEFAWCPKNDVELFYQNVIPTVTTLPNAHVAIMSTQNGFNLFYKLWKGSIEKTNIYANFKVDWNQVPQYNLETKQWEKRTEAWKQKMVGILGSEEAFYYQYGTQFSASDLCIVSRECLGVLRDKSILFETREGLEIYLQRKDNLFWHPDFNLDELKTGYFIILADLAEGGGGDSDSTVFHILQLTDKDKFRQVGYWKCNNLDLEHAALEYWLLSAQLFNDDRTIFSIEWNTYGALFYQYILNLNENDYMRDAIWRFNLSKDGFDTTRIIQYKKGSEEDSIPGVNSGHRKTIPGIRFSANSKKTACALLKMILEKFEVEITDLVTIGEIENFEDKNGNGSYKASYGHDDIVMTLCQLPMLKNTPKYKDFVEEFELHKLSFNLPNAQMNQPFVDMNGLGIYGEMVSISNPFEQLQQIDDLNWNSTLGNDLWNF